MRNLGLWKCLTELNDIYFHPGTYRKEFYDIECECIRSQHRLAMIHPENWSVISFVIASLPLKKKTLTSTLSLWKIVCIEAHLNYQCCNNQSWHVKRRSSSLNWLVKDWNKFRILKGRVGVFFMNIWRIHFHTQISHSRNVELNVLVEN